MAVARTPKDCPAGKKVQSKHFSTEKSSIIYSAAGMTAEATWASFAFRFEERSEYKLKQQK